MPDPDRVLRTRSFGMALRSRRDAEGLSQTELGEQFGVTQPTIARWELDKARPQRRHYSEVATFLRISIEDFRRALDVDDFRTHLMIVTGGERLRQSNSAPSPERPVHESPALETATDRFVRLFMDQWERDGEIPKGEAVDKVSRYLIDRTPD